MSDPTLERVPARPLACLAAIHLAMISIALALLFFTPKEKPFHVQRILRMSASGVFDDYRDVKFDLDPTGKHATIRISPDDLSCYPFKVGDVVALDYDAKPTCGEPEPSAVYAPKEQPK